MATIVDMNGEPVSPPGIGEPVEGVVKAMERLLEKAKAGELCGFIMVYLHSDWATGGVMAGHMNYSLIGRLEELKIAAIEEME